MPFFGLTGLLREAKTPQKRGNKGLLWVLVLLHLRPKDFGSFGESSGGTMNRLQELRDYLPPTLRMNTTGFLNMKQMHKVHYEKKRNRCTKHTMKKSSCMHAAFAFFGVCGCTVSTVSKSISLTSKGAQKNPK